jgi:excisionase family DNA binding protein
MADDAGDRRTPLQGERLVAVPEVARSLGIDVRLVQRAIEEGRLPAYRVGVHRRVRVVDVEIWLAGCHMAIVGTAVGALHGRATLPQNWIDGLLGRPTAADDGRVFELLSLARQRRG